MKVNRVQNNITLDLTDFHCIDKPNQTKNKEQRTKKQKTHKTKHQSKRNETKQIKEEEETKEKKAKQDTESFFKSSFISHRRKNKHTG